MRPPLADPLPSVIDSIAQSHLSAAQANEQNGNWFLAAEQYCNIAERLQQLSIPSRNIATFLARSAFCFELSNQHVAAAGKYDKAAHIIKDDPALFQEAGELFIRAADQSRRANDFFVAGTQYCVAATLFSKLNAGSITRKDHTPPAAGSSLKSYLVGACYEAAAEAYSNADPAWARSTYWRAGESYGEITCIQAVNAYRRAISISIQFDRTFDKAALKAALMDAGKDNPSDPVAVLEKSVFDLYRHQSKHSGALDDKWVVAKANRDLAAYFHDFFIGFTAIAHQEGASECYVAEMDCLRRALKAEGSSRAKLLTLWKCACNYGESLSRWACWCFIFTIFFGAVYKILSLLGRIPSAPGDPAVGWIDSFFFSLVTFTCFGYSDIGPKGAIAECVVAVEVILGLLMFGMLITYLGRRLSR